MGSKSEDILFAWSSFFEAHAFAIQQIEKEISGKAPLSLYEYDVLLTVDRSPEKRVRFSDLAAASVFTKSGITRVAKRMVERGYLARIQCEEDRRGAYAALTTSGSSALADTWREYSRSILEIFSPALSHRDALDLKRILDKVIEQLKPPALVSIGRGSN